MIQRWYYKHGGQIHGPVTAAQLEQRVQQGKLLPTDTVWPEGTPASEAVLVRTLPIAGVAPPGTVATSRPGWVEDLRTQVQPQPTPMTTHTVPDWLADVKQVEAEAAAVPVAEVAPEAPATIPVAQLSGPASPPAPPPASTVRLEELMAEELLRSATAVAVPAPQAGGGCRFLIGSASSRGRVRDRNEDSLLALHWTWGHLDERHDAALLLVADGMGGHDSGDRASALVVRSLAGLLAPLLLKLVQAAATPPSAAALADELIRALREANRVVHEVATANPACKGMGATAALVLLWNNQAIFSHVGDCRVYHCRQKLLTQVTRDQTLVARMVKLGQLTPEEAADHPRRNEVDQAIGPRTLIEPSRHILSLQPGDWLIVCCDGLYAHVDEAALGDALAQAVSAPVLATHLINLANEGGGSDNCTVIAAQCY